jgi:hypothetical protein
MASLTLRPSEIFGIWEFVVLRYTKKLTIESEDLPKTLRIADTVSVGLAKWND